MIDVFLHLGGDEIVHVKDIVAIMDIEKTASCNNKRISKDRRKKAL